MDVSPPFNYGLHAQTAGHTLWQDKRGRTNLWPGEAVLIGMVTYNNTEDPDVALLNVFGRMLSLLPHEVLLRPRLVCTRTQGHYHCHELPGIRDVVEAYSLSDYENPPLPLFPSAYCPCGFKAHPRCRLTTDCDVLIGLAMTGNLAYLLRGKIARGKRYLPLVKWDDDQSVRSNHSVRSIRIGLIFGGHMKNLAKHLPTQFHEKIAASPPLDCTNEHPSEVLCAHLLADPEGEVVDQWLRTTTDDHLRVLQCLIHNAVPACVLRKAVRLKAGQNAEGRLPLATDEMAGVVRSRFTAAYDSRFRGWSNQGVLRNQRAISNLWEPAVELGLVSLDVLSEVKIADAGTAFPAVYDLLNRVLDRKVPRSSGCCVHLMPKRRSYHGHGGNADSKYVPELSAKLLGEFCDTNAAKYYASDFKAYFREWPAEAQRKDISALAHTVSTAPGIKVLLQLVGEGIDFALLDAEGRTCVEAQAAAGRFDCVDLLQAFIGTHARALDESVEGMYLPF